MMHPLDDASLGLCVPRTSTTEFFLPNFSRVNGTAEVNVTPLKSQTDFTTPFSPFKGKIQQKIFQWQIYPYYTST
jgi:hypothetical protein